MAESLNREGDDPVFAARPRNVQHYRAARQVPSLADVMEPLEPAEGPRPVDRRSSLAPVAVTPPCTCGHPYHHHLQIKAPQPMGCMSCACLGYTRDQ